MSPEPSTAPAGKPSSPNSYSARRRLQRHRPQQHEPAAARLLGPGAAGALIFLIGTGPVFVVNAVTFVIQITCLLGLPRIKATRATPKSAVGGGMLTAIRYVWRRADLRLLFSIALAMGIFGFNFQITNPLMATQEFGKGAGESGALGSIMGSVR